MKRLRYWWPAIISGISISSFSTGQFTSGNTSRIIVPFLHWLLPHTDVHTLRTVHHLIRKGGHVFEYFIFALLVIYGIRAGRRVWRRQWAVTTLGIVAGYAAFDEIHQAFVPGRGASPWDSLLDTAAGALAVTVAWWWWRRHPAVAEEVEEEKPRIF